ncbi:DUF5995 family protein [Humibacillus xanthopallidus]|uniref:Uncharacterized protein n=1 Tax=Humibacillus xanthopallidus TaxID=412689 RepID=A0A543HJD3_9MICO|nr:DUF5995 family protein [Humibacillus xanthopallidus]TQM58452.1 hypothetical protein FBY41_3819 [Humibacillus xanthopallidus]
MTDSGRGPTVGTQQGKRSIADVIDRMTGLLDTMPQSLESRRSFLATYLRTTRAVDAAIRDGEFEDPVWVEAWDVVFADLYLDALENDLSSDPGRSAPRPWRLAFGAPEELAPLRHVLLGINAHINYDLPQALLGVISDAEFADPVVLAGRARDHERIDGVLSGRVAAEDAELASQQAKSLLDRVLTPLNRRASTRFLREARRKVWHNTLELQQARLRGPEAYAARLAELEVLSAARIADLLAPGQVLLRLAVAGFGVQLPPEA